MKAASKPPKAPAPSCDGKKKKSQATESVHRQTYRRLKDYKKSNDGVDEVEEDAENEPKAAKHRKRQEPEGLTCAIDFCGCNSAESQLTHSLFKALRCTAAPQFVPSSNMHLDFDLHAFCSTLFDVRFG